MTTPAETRQACLDLCQLVRRRYLAQKWIADPTLAELETPAETLAEWMTIDTDDPDFSNELCEQIEQSLTERNARQILGSTVRVKYVR